MKRALLNSERTRVVINAVHAKSGGGLTYLRNLLPELAAEEGLELHLFLHEDQYDRLAPFDERIRPHLFEFKPGFFRLLFWEQVSLPLLAYLMHADVTFSPANYGPLFAPAPVIMLRNSLAVATTERRPIKRLYWLGLAFMTALSLLSARRAIAVSRYARRALTFGFGRALGKRVAVIHHGVNPIFTPGPVEARDSRRILVVADIYIQKNLHNLLAALARVRDAVPEVQLTIAGETQDVPYHRELLDQVAALGLEGQVTFLGGQPASALAGLYRSCAFLVFPSTVETFGNPLVEAMASGTPIASSSTAAMPEILGEAALFFDPLDPDDMADKMIALLTDAELRRQFGERGLARAEMYSWRRAAAETGAALREAAS